MSNWKQGRQAKPQEANGCQQESVTTKKDYQEKITLWLINSRFAWHFFTFAEVFAVVFIGLSALVFLLKIPFGWSVVSDSAIIAALFVYRGLLVKYWYWAALALLLYWIVPAWFAAVFA